MMKSNSRHYKIQKGQRLVGNCHLAQRDPKVFQVKGSKGVDEFDPSRFKEKVRATPQLLRLQLEYSIISLAFTLTGAHS